MKLALLSPAAERQEARDRLRRARAAALALREVFPAVQQLRLELLFQGSTSTTPAPQSHILHAPARAFFEFPCPYADCDGQFDLSAAVKAALADPAHRATGALGCSGQRAVRVGARQPCQLRLNYTVTATCQPIPEFRCRRLRTCSRRGRVGAQAPVECGSQLLKYSSVAEKPVRCAQGRDLSACQRWPQRAHRRLPPSHPLTLAGFTNQEAGLTCSVFHLFVSTLQ